MIVIGVDMTVDLYFLTKRKNVEKVVAIMANVYKYNRHTYDFEDKHLWGTWIIHYTYL